LESLDPNEKGFGGVSSFGWLNWNGLEASLVSPAGLELKLKDVVVLFSVSFGAKLKDDAG
jgi:hypothetical protein